MALIIFKISYPADESKYLFGFPGVIFPLEWIKIYSVNL